MTTANDAHVTTLLGAVERLTERAREADAALAAVATEVEAFREAQRAFDAVNERREQRRRELEAFRHDVAALAREILGRVDGMFSSESAAAADEQRPEAGTAT
jgi:predicted  nucleic acid-binding Zn-ribbon protein